MGKKGWEQKEGNYEKSSESQKRPLIYFPTKFWAFLCSPIFLLLSRTFLTNAIWLYIQRYLCSGSQHLISKCGVWQLANLLQLNFVESANLQCLASSFYLSLFKLSLMFCTLSIRYILIEFIFSVFPKLYIKINK